MSRDSNGSRQKSSLPCGRECVGLDEFVIDTLPVNQTTSGGSGAARRARATASQSEELLRACDYANVRSHGTDEAFIVEGRVR